MRTPNATIRPVTTSPRPEPALIGIDLPDDLQGTFQERLARDPE